MLEVKADAKNRSIPFQYFMFDSWWYDALAHILPPLPARAALTRVASCCRYPKEGDPGSNSTHPWPVRDSNGMLSWTPEPQVGAPCHSNSPRLGKVHTSPSVFADLVPEVILGAQVFPSGVKDWLGLPTFLHARFLSPENVYRQQFADSMICEGSPSPSPLPPTPAQNFTCVNSGGHYCEHAGVYCSGKGRVQLENKAGVSLANCEASCTSHAECNCVSWAAKHSGDTYCRTFSKATGFTKSGSGFSAWVKPSKVADVNDYYTHRGGDKGTPGICLPIKADLFEHMMDGVSGWHPFVYEQDWISATFDHSKALTASTTTGNDWLSAMNDAAVSRNMTLQFSMSFTPAILQSSKMPALTQIRASGDYTPGSTSWRIAEESQVYWALGSTASTSLLQQVSV